jgi:hypothetical protein
MEKFDLEVQFNEVSYQVTVVRYDEPVIKFEVIGNCLQDFGLSESFWLYPDKESRTLLVDDPEAAEFKTAVAGALTRYCDANNLVIY